MPSIITACSVADDSPQPIDISLTINEVHSKEMVIDDSNSFFINNFIFIVFIVLFLITT